MKRNTGGKNQVARAGNDHVVEKLQPGKEKGGWQTIAGKACDDRLFRKAMNLGAKWRKQANAEGT